MRSARFKPVGADLPGTYYHLLNRIAGVPGEFHFGDVEKEMFIRLLKRWASLYALDVLAWQVMGNHFHLVVFAPAEPLSPVEAANRYAAFHRGKRFVDPVSPRGERLAMQLRDISCFMHDLQQQFASWYNRTRPTRRWGVLWGDRFKSVVLEGATAVWECIKYVELNCVRAGLVQDPADYRFGSWGEWNGTGTHPYAAALFRHLRLNLGEHAVEWSIDDFQRELRMELARVSVGEAHGTTENIEAARTAAANRPAPLLTLHRRVRYWSDGLIIGTKLFIRTNLGTIIPAERLARHQYPPAVRFAWGTAATSLTICAWRRLRLADG